MSHRLSSALEPAAEALALARARRRVAPLVRHEDGVARLAQLAAVAAPLVREELAVGAVRAVADGLDAADARGVLVALALALFRGPDGLVSHPVSARVVGSWGRRKEKKRSGGAVGLSWAELSLK